MQTLKDIVKIAKEKDEISFCGFTLEHLRMMAIARIKEYEKLKDKWLQDFEELMTKDVDDNDKLETMNVTLLRLYAKIEEIKEIFNIQEGDLNE